VSVDPGRQRADTIVIGAGPGGAISAALLAEAGRDVLLLEEGPHLPLDSASHFSRDEIAQKYRNGGITVGMGRAKVSYVEGCCVGGGSEVNRGLYQRTPPEVLEAWRREFAVEALDEAQMRLHHEACERIACVSDLQGPAPAPSLKLAEGAARMGWSSVAVPRLVSYAIDPATGAVLSRKQSMSETFVPRFVKAGGRLLPETRALRLSHHGGYWRVRARMGGPGQAAVGVDLEGGNVIVAGGPIQTPALLRRSGITRKIGNTLRFHPMVKLVAQFAEEVNTPGQLDPVHQIKHFDPQFSMGCSISAPPTLALIMIDHPEHFEEVDQNWRHLAIYYVQTTGGQGTVRTLPGFHDALVRARYNATDMRKLAEGLRKLGECLYAAGATALYPGIAGMPMLRSPGDLNRIPTELPARQAGLATFHLFATCPMGEKEGRCATDSFGKVRGADGLYVNDASLLPGPTVVNPQGTVMAIAHRNALRFLENRR
jgi:choline dehydrogenase-like flavoprotein